MLAPEGRAKFCGDFIIIEAFDRGHPRSIAGDGVNDAGTSRHIVEQQRACSAHPVLAAKMGAGQIEAVTQKIGEMGARFCRRIDSAPVHDKRDHGHAEASLIARRSTVT